MCGLVGVAGVLTAKEETAFKQMLIVDSLRGVDSTGIATIRKHNAEVTVAKQVGHAMDFVESHRYTKAMQGIFRAIIGHNRWGTVGKNSNRNAHPFDFDNIVGAHNGTLTSKWRFNNHTMYDVDSEAMYAHMNENGLRDTMTKMDGAWAMTWWDKEDDTLNFLRNKERPLWMCYSTDGKTLFWASETWMLHGMLGRNAISYGPLAMLEEDTHISIHINEKGEMDKPVATPMPSALPKTYVTHGHYSNGGKWTAGGPVEEKKQLGAATPLQNSQVAHVKPGYQTSKAVTFEVLNVRNDKFGAPYFDLMDRENKSLCVRWYFQSHKVNSLDYVGEEIIADVKEMKSVPGEGTYYKVDVQSVRLISPVGGEKEEGSADEVFQGADRQFYDLSAWSKKWGTCNWCTGNVSPEGKHGFDHQSHSYCEDCVEDPQVREFVNLNIVEAATPY